jgi:hypothetical protein
VLLLMVLAVEKLVLLLSMDLYLEHLDLYL